MIERMRKEGKIQEARLSTYICIYMYQMLDSTVDIILSLSNIDSTLLYTWHALFEFQSN